MLSTTALTMVLMNAHAHSLQFRPSEMKVVLLPTVNITGDKHIALKAEQVRESDETLNRLFGERGFNLVARKEVEDAIAESKLDLTDEENYRKELLYNLGQKLNADILVFNVVTRTMQKKRNDLFENLEGFATMRTWVLDVKNKQPFLKGDSYDGVSAKNNSVGFGRQVRAVRIGLENQLKEFLKPFPKVKG